MRPSRRAALLTPVVVLWLAGCAGPDTAERAAAVTTAADEVVARDLAFVPREVRVAAGATVAWTFADGGVPHDVRGDGFSSERKRVGTFRHRFARPGTYEYRCTLHPGMTGRVTVVAG
jgi:plastocyanin